jgi:hypothetical protein
MWGQEGIVGICILLFDWVSEDGIGGKMARRAKENAQRADVWKRRGGIP